METIEGDSTISIIIPLTTNNSNLSSIIIGEIINDTFSINCYTTNNYLYNVTHGTNVDTTRAKDNLATFFYMENYTFGTTQFYHIPPDLFGRSTALDIDGNKTITIQNVPPSNNVMVCICVTVVCPICLGNDPNCPLGGSWQECSCTSTGGGGNTGCPWCPPPPPPGGGGGGGGGTPSPCPSGMTSSWYSLSVVNPNPCNPPPPPPPNPCDSVIGKLENDSYFKANFQWLTTNTVISSDHEFGFAVSNRAQNLYEQKEGQPNSESIDWGIGANTFFDGFLHSHFCETTTNCLSPMFSPQDVVQMAQVFLTGHARDTNNLFFGVASGSGNPYLIKITNAAAFRTFAQNIAGVDGRDEKKINKFRDRYKDSFNYTDMAQNELSFLNMLQKEGGLNGLGFYRSYSDCHNWQKLGLDGLGGMTILNCY